MINADAKTGIIAKAGDNIVLLSDVAMIGYVLKETSPEGIYTAFKKHTTKPKAKFISPFKYWTKKRNFRPTIYRNLPFKW